MPTPRHPLRERIMTRIKRGEFASVREIMLVGSLPRQTVNRWLREEKVDLGQMRLRHMAKLHAQEEAYLESLSGKPRISKRRQWLETQRAVRRFNAANSKEPGSARAEGSAAAEME